MQFPADVHMPVYPIRQLWPADRMTSHVDLPDLSVREGRYPTVCEIALSR